MTLIDWILLLTVLAVTGYKIVLPTGKWQWHLLGIVCVLIATQLLISGFLWPFVPTYFLVALLALSSLKLSAKLPTWRIWLTRIVLLFAFLLAIAPFAILVPVPVLPTPSGPFSIGTKIYRWVDTLRNEEATDNITDKRNVIAQAWYPTELSDKQRSVYMDGLSNLPFKKIGLETEYVMGGYDRINTHAMLNAQISNKKLWPVVIFSPGFGASRSWYTGLVTELVSRGYVVITLDHPYESPITELANGTIARRIDTSPRDTNAREPWMATQLGIRATDFQFAIDRIIEGLDDLKGHLDFSRIVAVGHSFGGATAVAATGRDPRIGAVVNIDGTLYGEVPELHRPFLLLQSDYAVTGHGDAFKARNQQLLEHTTAPAWRYEILGANHLVFMDVLYFLSAPVKWVLKKKYGGNLFGGERKPKEIQYMSSDILDAFIRETLYGEKDLVKRSVAKYSDIKGGLQVVPKTVSPQTK